MIDSKGMTRSAITKDVILRRIISSLPKEGYGNGKKIHIEDRYCFFYFILIRDTIEKE